MEKELYSLGIKPDGLLSFFFTLVCNCLVTDLFAFLAFFWLISLLSTTNLSYFSTLRDLNAVGEPCEERRLPFELPQYEHKSHVG